MVRAARKASLSWKGYNASAIASAMFTLRTVSHRLHNRRVEKTGIILQRSNMEYFVSWGREASPFPGYTNGYRPIVIKDGLWWNRMCFQAWEVPEPALSATVPI